MRRHGIAPGVYLSYFAQLARWFLSGSHFYFQVIADLAQPVLSLVKRSMYFNIWLLYHLEHFR